MTYPKISIVTPSFNQGQYIDQTIESVLNQDYPNLEYIVIDGGSTDNTVETIRKYEKYLTYWVSEPDKGQTDAINKGFKKSTGEIFNWLNSDDYYAAGALKIVGEAFSSNELTRVVCGKEWGFYDANPTETIAHEGSIICNTVEETIFTGIIDQPCTFFRKKDVEAFFPLTSSLKYVMDRELWLKYVCQYGIKDIKQLPDVLTWFRLHPTSKSVKEGNKFATEFALLRLQLLKKINAPQWLIDDVLLQVGGNSRDLLSENSLTLPAVSEDRLLGVFAYDFAKRCYVRNDIRSAYLAMQFIYKSGELKKEYISLFIKAGLLPPEIIKGVKQLKKSLSWKN